MYSILFFIVVVEGLFIIGYISGDLFFWYSDIYLLNFGVAMLQYEVYSKLMNRVYLLEYGVFIR